MVVEIRLALAKGDPNRLQVEYCTILDSGVFEYQLAGTTDVRYLAAGSWVSVQGPHANRNADRPGFG